MAKKTTTQKPTEPNSLITAEKPAGETTVKPVAKQAAKTTKAKPSVPRTRVKATVVTKPGSAAASITPADIALRAYFIAEKRQKLGLPGDSTNDWVEAERQLKAEAAAPKAAK